MRSVNVAELQNDLSAYLTFAEAGEEVEIRDHDRPVAKLVPFPVTADEQGLKLPSEMEAMLTPFNPDEDATEEDRELAAAGILRLPKYKLDMEAFLKLPKAKTRDGGSAVQALLDERAEGR